MEDQKVMTQKSRSSMDDQTSTKRDTPETNSRITRNAYIQPSQKLKKVTEIVHEHSINDALQFMGKNITGQILKG